MRFLLSCTLLLCLVSFAQKAFSAPQPSLESADSLGEELYARSGATGMVVVVVHKNQVFIGGYGRTAPGSRLRPDQHSFIRLCSVTKIFTTDVLAKLAHDGVVRLDDPLQKYAPANFVVPSRKQPITLLNLATHTAGLYREVGYPPDGTPHFTYPDYNLRWSWLSRQHLRSTPGTFAAYSNVGFDLLSDALSSAAHKPYSNLLHEKTLTPLRMWDTTYYPNASQCSRLLIGSRDQSPCTVTANTEGSAGLYSTPIDMARWLKYLVNAPGSPAPPRETLAAYLDAGPQLRQTGLNYAGNPSALGLGWLYLLSPDDPSHLIQKDGGGAGYLTYIAVHPASQSAIFVAMTVGRNGYHANLFKASNSVLLKLAGAPLIPEPTGKVPGRMRHGKLVNARGQALSRQAQKQASKQATKTRTAKNQPQASRKRQTAKAPAPSNKKRQAASSRGQTKQKRQVQPQKQRRQKAAPVRKASKAPKARKTAPSARKKKK